MGKKIACDVVSAEGEVFSADVDMVIVHGVMGELGIAPNHAPLLTYLQPGPVRLIEAGEEGVFYVSGGIMEVQSKRVTILTDLALRASDLDELAALDAKKRAEDALLDQHSEMQYSSASAHLAEAAAQLRTIRAFRKKMGRG